MRRVLPHVVCLAFEAPGLSPGLPVDMHYDYC